MKLISKLIFHSSFCFPLPLPFYTSSFVSPYTPFFTPSFISSFFPPFSFLGPY